MINFINKAFLSFIIFITSYSLVVAQTASLLPNAVQQFFDNNGNPLTSGKVYTYVPSTTTLKTTWKDSAETPSLAHTNPIILNAAGRPPNDTSIYGQGTYRQLVKDANGNTIWDQLTAPGGGGGSGTTGTGDGDLVGTVKPWAGIVAPNQYVFAYGQEVSRSTYSVLLTAVTFTTNVICTSSSNTLSGLSDTSQIPIGAAVELACVSPGTTVVSKTSATVVLSNPSSISLNTSAIFYPYGNGNGTTTFNIPDLRGYTIAGRTNMGGVTASNLTSTYFGTSPNASGAKGGSQSHTLIQAELPAFKPAITITDPGHIHGLVAGIHLLSDTTGSSAGGSPGSGVTTIASATTGITAALASNLGSGTPHSIVQPTITMNYIIKVTPDSNSPFASGVTSLGGMTGDIFCGAGLTCSGNIISSALFNTNAFSVLCNPNVSPGVAVSCISPIVTTINATTSAVTPFIAGGTTASSVLQLTSTTGVGTTDVIQFLTGSQVPRFTINTDGSFIVGPGKSSIAVDLFGEASNPALTAWDLANSDSSAISAGTERYTATLFNTSAGTGDGTVPGSTYVLGLSMIKDNWKTTTVNGQVGSLQLFTRGGDNNALDTGDTSTVVFNTGVSYTNNYTAGFEGTSGYFPVGSTTGSTYVRMYFGAIRQSGLGDLDNSNSVGIFAAAQNGASGIAFGASNLGTSPAFGNTASWKYFLKYDYDDTSHASYTSFNVNKTGQMTLANFGAINTNQKTIDVSSNTLRILSAAASPATLWTLNDSGNMLSVGTIEATGVYRQNGVAGISATATVRNSAGSGTCTFTINGGIITATTC